MPPCGYGRATDPRWPAFEHPFGFDLDQPTGQLCASTIGSAMTWNSLPLVMVRAGREFSNWLAAGPPSFIVDVSEP